MVTFLLLNLVLNCSLLYDRFDISYVEDEHACFHTGDPDQILTHLYLSAIIAVDQFTYLSSSALLDQY